MTSIARETSVLRRGGVLAPLVVTYTYICLSVTSTAHHHADSAETECSPTDTINQYTIPRLRRLPYTRLLSTRGTSTSELLRTL